MTFADRLTLKPSRGHWAWAFAPGAGLVEYFTDGHDIHRAPVDNVIDCSTGFRFGRWEGPDRPGVRENIRDVWRSMASCWEESSSVLAGAVPP